MSHERPPSSSNPSSKPPTIDWDDLRAKSLRPGGFREDRVHLWPKLLNVAVPEETNVADDQEVATDEKPPHHDERQIGLDTDRSFVLYPVDEMSDKDALQAGLHKLLVSLFRNRPKLSYFQGYHDIISVIFLSLPPALHLPCTEKLSLHRLRDSMGSGLEPVLGLLRISKSLLRLADSDYADLLESTSPLPFYALSNLLTLFSHDTPTLSLIQHIFDYLLCRPPIASVYLTVAILLSRKEDVLRLHEQDEEGMIHSLLSSFPQLGDDPVIKADADPSPQAQDTFFNETSFLSSQPDSLRTTTKHPAVADLALSLVVPDPEVHNNAGIAHPLGLEPIQLESRPDPIIVKLETSCENAYTTIPTLPPPLASDDHAHIELTSGSVDHDRQIPPPSELSSDQTSVKRDSSHASSGVINVDDDRLDHNQLHEGQAGDAVEDALTAYPNPKEGPADLEKLDESRTARVEGCPDLSVDPPSSTSRPVEPEKGDSENDSTTTKIEPWAEHSLDNILTPQKSSPILQLSDLLRRADELYARFPPTHPALGVSSIMGPQSVIFTWSENPSLLPSDNTAEAMVMHPELVVYPYVEPPPDSKEKVKEEARYSGDDDGKVKLWKRYWRRGKRTPRGTKKNGRDALLVGPFGQVEKRTAAVVASAAVVLAVAVAVYGIKSRHGPDRFGHGWLSVFY